MLGLLTPADPLDPAHTLVARMRHQAEQVLGMMQNGTGAGERKVAVRLLGETTRAALSPLEFLTSALHGWVAFLVMPIFAFANAGVRIDASALTDPAMSMVTLAVAAGLFFGKPLGIVGLTWLAVRAGVAVLPRNVDWNAVWGAGILGGIGFTMALFVTSLAFRDAALIDASKVGILSASVAATLVGLTVLILALPAAKPRKG